MSLEELEKYENLVCRIKYAYEFRNFEDWYSVIGSITLDREFEYIYVGHPFDEERHYVTAGQSGIRYNVDKYEISPITEKEFENWKQSYEVFHKSILREKGYDSCEEDIDKLDYLKN